MSGSGSGGRSAPASEGRGAGKSGVYGVVVGAGRSKRFGGTVPKQFLDLLGKPVIQRAVEALSGHPGIEAVVVVLPESEIGSARGAALGRLPRVRAVVAGGPSRADSVLCGLRAAPGAEFVLVHDAARPLAGAHLVDAVLEATLRHGAAIPVVEAHDTVKEVGLRGVVERTLERGRLRLAQTPQGARADWLLEALEAAAGADEPISDEAAALERVGRPVHVVPGDPRNLKITTAEDLERATRLSGADGMDLRVGTGFDVHRFAAGRRLVLGGVEFPDQPGLEGHSDADVVLHAVMDALLGAACLGDLGAHFPPEDASFAGVSSVELLARVRGLVAEAGFSVVNVDVSVLAERPRIREHAARMRERVASVLGVPAERVGLKATTLEGLGALGRAEGIACQVVALLRRGQP